MSSANGVLASLGPKEDGIDFRILGPLEVAENGRALALGRGRQRALLAVLLLRTNEVVGQDRLIDALWGESPPATALTALHGYVSGLRKLLGADRLETRQPGYVLRVEPGELDLHRFERLLEQERYGEALALWRGPPLSDLAVESFAQVEIARLEELRLAALEGRFDRELAGDRHAELVPELEALVREHPLRERFAAQLMLALYRSGRQADALSVYGAARARLVEELGLDPGDELRQLQRRILEHDPALHAAVPARRRTNLPAPTTSFVGRVRELEQTRALLGRPDVRLLTLTGAGGTGKTRLALEVARALADDFADGVSFVPLAPVTDPALVGPAIAQTLELRQSQGQSIVDALKDFARGRELLLVLDNFEHLLEAAAIVGELLAAAPALTILATSRTYLNLYGESEYAVPPLSLPDLGRLPDLEALARLEAVSLFVDRARAVRADFALTASNAATVAEICARLDGLPLAIELAAARIRALAPADLLARLERRLELLTGGPRDAHARQRTLRDTILWSYDLLSPAEQRLFARLAVFAGGWSLAAADDVCCHDLALECWEGLTSLGEKNLVRQEAADDQARFTMLETIRELALERLAASPDEHAIRSRHAHYFLVVAEDGGPNRRGAERAAWLDRLGREHENLRAALAWSAGDGDVEVGLRLAGALSAFWTVHGQVAEGSRFLAALLARSDEPTVGRARALAIAGLLALLEGDLNTTERVCPESLRLSRAGEEWHRAVCLNALGTANRYRGAYEEARRLYHEALALSTQHDLWWPTSLALGNLGTLAAIEGNHGEAVDRHERCIAIAREGGDEWITATSLSNLGRAVRHAGDLERAIALQAEALDCFVRLEHSWGLAVCLDAFAGLALDRGDYARAARLYGAEAAVRQRAGIPLWQTIRTEHEAGIEAAAAALGEPAWSRAWSDGQALTQDEAIAEAAATGALKARVARG
jgi:predicted ATPase/DNA-binding SARP family transcriptional activator